MNSWFVYLLTVYRCSLLISKILCMHRFSDLSSIHLEGTLESLNDELESIQQMLIFNVVIVFWSVPCHRNVKNSPMAMLSHFVQREAEEKSFTYYALLHPLWFTLRHFQYNSEVLAWA